MHLLCLGLNHTTADIQLRERLDFSDESARATLARMGCGTEPSLFSEMVILSTCNRIEFYAIGISPSFTELEALLSEARGVSIEEIHAHLYCLTDRDVVHHLLEVSAGLDSQVLGEPQILGQVTHALELARGQATIGPILSRLFQAAIHAGKRARVETSISKNPASVSSTAATLSERVVPNLSQARVVILGAGEVAELVVESLRKRGVERIVVVNRTKEHASLLANRWEAEAATFDQLEVVLSQADVLISSTGAPHTLIHASLVAEIMKARPNRPLVMIDIAVPRDIDEDTASIPNVRLYDIDHLNQSLEKSLAERAEQVPLVREILREEESEFVDYFHSLEMLPLIAELRQKAELIRKAELEKTLRRIPDLGETARFRIEAMSLALVKKILEAPTQRLRSEAACPNAAEYATIARSLFGLTDATDDCFTPEDDFTASETA